MEYNLNALTEIQVTDSYLGLDQDLRKCQNEEPFYNCTTRTYIDTIFEECGCFPFHMKVSKKVAVLLTIINNIIKQIKQFRISAPLSRWNVLTMSLLTHPVVSNLVLV